MSDIEQAIKAAGADRAPRVTPDDLNANIVSEHYFTAAEGYVGALSQAVHDGKPCATTAGEALEIVEGPLSLLTFCVLVLRNGFTVTGKSACASPENFNAAIGKKIAREDAIQQMWPLMGYALKEKLFTAPPPRATVVDVACVLDKMTFGWRCCLQWSDGTTTEGGGLSQGAAKAIAQLKKYPDLKD